MNLLLDTHALIWALSAPKRLPGSVARAVADPDNSVHISAVSTWEIAIKSALGKIKADLDEIAAAARDTGFVELPVRIRDTIRLRSLPAHHRDPFDRMLIAQALERRVHARHARSRLSSVPDRHLVVVSHAGRPIGRHSRAARFTSAPAT